MLSPERGVGCGETRDWETGRLCVLLAPSPHALLSPTGENSIFEAFQKPFHQWQELLPAGQLTGFVCPSTHPPTKDGVGEVRGGGWLP